MQHTAKAPEPPSSPSHAAAEQTPLLVWAEPGDVRCWSDMKQVQGGCGCPEAVHGFCWSNSCRQAAPCRTCWAGSGKVQDDSGHAELESAVVPGKFQVLNEPPTPTAKAAV